MLVLEAEAQPGYHSTGRSAAIFTETYGLAGVRALTSASREFFETAAGSVEGFTDTPLLSPRGLLWVATPERAAELRRQRAALEQHVSALLKI